MGQQAIGGAIAHSASALQRVAGTHSKTPPTRFPWHAHSCTHAASRITIRSSLRYLAIVTNLTAALLLLDQYPFPRSILPPTISYQPLYPSESRHQLPAPTVFPLVPGVYLFSSSGLRCGRPQLRRTAKSCAALNCLRVHQRTSWACQESSFSVYIALPWIGRRFEHCLKVGISSAWQADTVRSLVCWLPPLSSEVKR